MLTADTDTSATLTESSSSTSSTDSSSDEENFEKYINYDYDDDFGDDVNAQSSTKKKDADVEEKRHKSTMPIILMTKGRGNKPILKTVKVKFVTINSVNIFNFRYRTLTLWQQN
jgi:hypothetical protein